MQMPSTFGDIIYRRRKALSLTQEELADKVGVKPTYIGYLERGKRRPGPRIVSALAEHLNLNKSYLYLAANPTVKDFLRINEETNEIAERPIPQALIELREDRPIRDFFKITDDELVNLVKLDFLGQAKTKQDYVLLIQTLRKIFKE